MSANEMPLREARAQIGHLVDRAEHHGETTVITRYGRPAAMLVPYIEEPTVTQSCDYEFEIMTNEDFEDHPRWDRERDCLREYGQRSTRDVAMERARKLLDEYPAAHAVDVYESVISASENEFGTVDEERGPLAFVANVTR